MKALGAFTVEFMLTAASQVIHKLGHPQSHILTNDVEGGIGLLVSKRFGCHLFRFTSLTRALHHHRHLQLPYGSMKKKTRTKKRKRGTRPDF